MVTTLVAAKRARDDALVKNCLARLRAMGVTVVFGSDIGPALAASGQHPPASAGAK